MAEGDQRGQYQDQLTDVAQRSGRASMFLEIAQVDIKPGQEAEFEAGAAKAAPYSSAPRAARRCRCSARSRSRRATGCS